jgi:hypothetical protein
MIVQKKEALVYMPQFLFGSMILGVFASVSLGCCFLFFTVDAGFFDIFEVFKLFSELVKAHLRYRFDHHFS